MKRTRALLAAAALAAIAAVAAPGASPGATGPNGETMTLSADCSTYPPQHGIAIAFSGFRPHTVITGRVDFPDGGNVEGGVVTDDNGNYTIGFGSSRPGVFNVTIHWPDGDLADSIYIDCAGTPRTIGLDPSGLVFNGQNVGYFSRPEQMTVTNPGPDVLDFRAARPVGAHADEYLIASDSCSGEALAVGETCFVRVRFGPDAVGQRNSYLELSTSATSEPFRARLFGTAIAPPSQHGPPISGSVRPTAARAGAKNCLDFQARTPSGRPLADARAGFAGAHGLTGSDGTVTLCAIFPYPGTRTARITKRGYRSDLLLIPVRPSQA
jgi:hypothetical protein